MSTTSVEPATPTSYVPSRRTVLRAAAWTAPAVSVAVAVPAYAACSPAAAPVQGVIDWDATTGSRWNRRSIFSRDSDSRGGSYTLSQPGADPLLVTVRAGYENSMRPLTGWTMRTHSPVGGLANVSGLCLAQYNLGDNARTSNRRLDRGTYTFTFARPVTNLYFTVTDIDSLPGDYLDMIEVSAVVPHTEMGPKGAGVKGAGTTASPYTAINGNRQVPDPASNAGNVAADSGNVRVQFPGAVSSFTITYWNDVAQFTEDTTQGVWISDMSFQYSPSATC
ncbi:hypothetical protein Pve01_85880 [Planomonospora venezuelensis]|nr:hypothetical protein Pve01_85880 [Planomonospora venezuelensis]